MVTAPMVAAAGQFLGGVGSIANAFGGGGSKLDEGAMRAGSYLTQLHDHDNFVSLFRAKQNMAKEHGLHPLTVLGVPFQSSGMPVVSGSDSGPDFAAIGDGIGNIGRSLVKPPENKDQPDPMQQRLINAQVRLAEANAKRAEWEALRSEFAAADSTSSHLLQGQPGNPPGVRVSNDVAQMQGLVAEQSGIPRGLISGATAPIEIKQTVAPPHPRNVGYTAATDQGWQRLQDRDGSQVSVVRQDAVQSDIEKGATFQWLAKHFGIDKALLITGIMENEHLLMGTAAAGGFLLRHPAARLGLAVGRRLGLIPKTPYKPNWKGGK